LNVKFLKGSQAEFENVAGRYKPGAFYLVINDDKSAEDYKKPSRLYYGVDENNCVPVNQGINVVDTTAGLPQGFTQNTAGEFYYVKDKNILCINNGKGWIQTNTDTVLNTNKKDSNVSVNSNPEKPNGVSITNTIADSSGNIITETYDIIGSDYIQIEAIPAVDDKGVDTVKLSLKGINYQLSSSLNEKTLNVNLKNSDTDAGNFNIIAGSNVNIAETSTGNYTLSVNKAVDSIDVINRVGGTGFIASISGPGVEGAGNGTTLSADIDPEIALEGKTGGYKFKDGVLTLPVYSKQDIDNQLRSINAMVFRGGFQVKDGAIAYDNSDITEITEGNTFIYTGAEDTLWNGHYLRPGDLIIASSEEVNGAITGTINWTYVPSADDPVTEIEGANDNSTAGFIIKLGSTKKLLDYALNGESGIVLETKVLTDSKGQPTNSKVVTIKHSNTLTVNTPVSQSYADEQTITINEPTEIDAQGHVIKSTQKTFTVKNTHQEIANADYTVNGTDTLIPNLKVAGADLEGKPLVFTSNSLKVNVSAATVTDDAKVNFELEWGTF
jgi:hypothetical protein